MCTKSLGLSVGFDTRKICSSVTRVVSPTKIDCFCYSKSFIITGYVNFRFYHYLYKGRSESSRNIVAISTSFDQ